MVTAKKILLVDDDAISLHLLSAYLAETDYSYVTAVNGLQAWELLQANPAEFSLVISDRIMPKLHGIDLLKKMLAHPLLLHVPLIMLTGVAEKAEVLEAIGAGVKDFLYKPVEKDLLLAVLKRHAGQATIKY
jgi:CheY-like chemotaxis protein